MRHTEIEPITENNAKRFEFTSEQWAGMIDRTTAFMIVNARLRRLPTYSEVVRDCDLRHKSGKPLAHRGLVLSTLLSEVCHRSMLEKGIQLAAITVNKITGLPGAGFYKCAIGADKFKGDHGNHTCVQPMGGLAGWLAEVSKVFAAYAS